MPPLPLRTSTYYTEQYMEFDEEQIMYHLVYPIMFVLALKYNCVQHVWPLFYDTTHWSWIVQDVPDFDPFKACAINTQISWNSLVNLNLQICLNILSVCGSGVHSFWKVPTWWLSGPRAGGQGVWPLAGSYISCWL